MPKKKLDRQRLDVATRRFSKQQATAWLQDPEELSHGGLLLDDVVKRLMAEDHVEFVVRQVHFRRAVGLESDGTGGSLRSIRGSGMQVWIGIDTNDQIRCESLSQSVERMPKAAPNIEYR